MMSEWIDASVKPEERDSIFAKFYGTDKWNKNMFLKTSGELIVTIEHKGIRLVTTATTCDGKWNCDYLRMWKETKVVAWMPYPEPYRGEVYDLRRSD